VARYQLAKKKKWSGTRAGLGLALFLIVCGLLLVAGGASGISCGRSDARQAAAKQLLKALRSAGMADRALESGNYGNARSHVRSTQDAITEALNALSAGPEAEGP
jgi:hypothetical protein